MITVVGFFQLIHILLIGLYLFTIGQYAVSRLRHPEIYKALPLKAPGMRMKNWEANSEGVMVIAGLHVVIFGMVVEAVPLFLIILIICSVLADVQYETAQPFIKVINRHHSGSQAKGGSQQNDYSQHDDRDFEFDESAWKGGGQRSGASSAGAGRAPDYASALRDAQLEADKISDERAAKFAKVWEKLAREPGLSPKIKLFRELVAMLLTERAKGFKGRADQSEPTQDEIKALTNQ